LGADVFNADVSVLNSIESGRLDTQRILSSYIRCGGNFLLCGIQPLNALRYFDSLSEPGPILQPHEPVEFERTLDDPDLVPNWVAADLRVARVESTHPNHPTEPVLTELLSQVESGPHPYPSIEFDPLSIPNGPEKGGFRYFDAGIIPRAGGEVIYRNADTNESIGVRRLTVGGSNGSVVYLGFHPWFVKKSQFAGLIQAVLADFETYGRPSGEFIAGKH
jgi:hypothetical protein